MRTGTKRDEGTVRAHGLPCVSLHNVYTVLLSLRRFYLLPVIGGASVLSRTSMAAY
jgi:hypothetical protein